MNSLYNILGYKVYDKLHNKTLGEISSRIEYLKEVEDIPYCFDIKIQYKGFLFSTDSFVKRVVPKFFKKCEGSPKGDNNRLYSRYFSIYYSSVIAKGNVKILIKQYNYTMIKNN